MEPGTDEDAVLALKTEVGRLRVQADRLEDLIEAYIRLLARSIAELDRRRILETLEEELRHYGPEGKKDVRHGSNLHR